MTSKEALEKIGNFLGKSPYQKNINIIKQDLERLEQLEKENQELKAKADKYDSAQRIVLSTKGIDVMMKLQAENETLKKAIEILKGENGAKLIGIDNKYRIYLVDYELVKQFITREKYELLSEVLENEIYK